jgi:elongation factor G
LGGLIDLVKMCAYIYGEDSVNGVRYETLDIPVDMMVEAKKYRESLIEVLADFDNTIAEKYLEGLPLGEDELRIAIRKATMSMQFIGVIPGRAFKNKGVQMLLDAVVNYLPSPLDLPPVRAFKDDDSG